MNSAKARLIEKMPLMQCGNQTEFRQRLQWLSEGMLRNHLEHVICYTSDLVEIEAYLRYKEEMK
jgi:hypothetical protein